MKIMLCVLIIANISSIQAMDDESMYQESFPVERSFQPTVCSNNSMPNLLDPQSPRRRRFFNLRCSSQIIATCRSCWEDFEENYPRGAEASKVLGCFGIILGISLPLAVHFSSHL
jgi:hypothetical protein